MADFALAQGERIEIVGPTNCSYGTPAHNKGAFVQMIAATAFKYEAIDITLMQPGGDGGGECFLIDIAIGPAGGETVIVPNLLLDSLRCAHASLSKVVSLPISVPKGARISIRCQDTLGAGVRNACVLVLGKSGGASYPKALASQAVCYGALTASTNGTLIDQGATANAWGAWTEITSATVATHSFFNVIGGNDRQSSATVQNVQGHVQLAVGPSGSEQVIWQGMCGGRYESGWLANFLPCFARIPAGTRLAMRFMATAATAAERHFTAVVIAG